MKKRHKRWGHPPAKFRKVVLPELSPALIAGVALFTRSLGEFGGDFIAGNIAGKQK